MTRWHALGWSGLLAGAWLGASGCRAADCPLVGCVGVVVTTFELPVTPAELDGTRLEICRNGQCTYAQVLFLDGEVQCWSGYHGGADADCFVDPATAPAATSVRFAARWTPNGRSPEAPLDAEDEYSARLFEASMEVTLAARSGRATYSTRHPFGEACAACTSGRF